MRSKRFTETRPELADFVTAKKRWTRSQRIRTFAKILIEAAILGTRAAPIYQ
jgi:hypothetical protein